MTAVYIKSAGWVLPGTQDCGATLTDEVLTSLTDFENSQLNDFSVKPYIKSVKGYLDPSSSYLLAACSLALQGSEENELTRGMISFSKYGAFASATKFFQLLAQKGPRFASPLVFPHGYANTPGNLAAIEFKLSGPHMVLWEQGSLTDMIWMATDAFAKNQADEMLVAAYEAAPAYLTPENTNILNGAVAILLTKEQTANKIELRDNYTVINNGAVYNFIESFI